MICCYLIGCPEIGIEYYYMAFRNAVPPQERDTSYAHLAAVGAQVVDGHNIVRKKYFPLDIREEASLGSLLVIIDEVMGITVESE